MEGHLEETGSVDCPAVGRESFLGRKLFYYLSELFSLTVELLCLQSVKVLIRRTFPL